MNQDCKICGANQLAEGSMTASNKAKFHPKKTKFWTFWGVPVTATMCRKCGHIELFGDCATLAEITAG